MLEGRYLSTLSTRGRVSRLLELAEANNRILRAGQVQHFAREEHERNEQRRRDFERLEKATARARREQEKKRQLLQEIGDVDLCTKKVADHAGKEAFVLAYTENGKWYKEGAPANRGQDWPVHQSTEPLPPFSGCGTRGGWVVFSTAKQGFSRRWRSSTRGPHCTGSPTPPPRTGQACAFAFCQANPFGRPEGSRSTGTRSSYFPSLARRVLLLCGELLQNQETQDLLEQRRVLEQELAETDSKLERGLAPPRQKDCFPALAMEPGYYTVLRYAETVAYGKPRAIFYMAPRNADGRCDQWRQKPVRGVFLAGGGGKAGLPTRRAGGQAPGLPPRRAKDNQGKEAVPPGAAVCPRRTAPSRLESRRPSARFPKTARSCRFPYRGQPCCRECRTPSGQLLLREPLPGKPNRTRPTPPAVRSLLVPAFLGWPSRSTSCLHVGQSLSGRRRNSKYGQHLWSTSMCSML